MTWFYMLEQAVAQKKFILYAWVLALQLELMMMLLLLDWFQGLLHCKPFKNRVYALCDGMNAMNEELAKDGIIGGIL